MEDFLEKTGRISVCVVLSILKTVPVSREFTVMICFSSENSIPKVEDLCFDSLFLLNKHQMLRGSFINVFRGYYYRDASVRHEYVLTLTLHFTLSPSSTAASISKPRQFLESLEVCKQMYKCLILFEEIRWWQISGKLYADFRLPGTYYFENRTWLPGM